MVDNAAVGAVGVPVNDGDAIIALNNISAVLAVMLAVLALMAVVLLEILAVFAEIKVGNVVMVDEITPPTLFTTGKSAVPPKSFVSFKIPFTVAEASEAVDLVTLAATKAVVAI